MRVRCVCGFFFFLFCSLCFGMSAKCDNAHMRPTNCTCSLQSAFVRLDIVTLLSLYFGIFRYMYCCPNRMHGSSSFGDASYSQINHGQTLLFGISIDVPQFVVSISMDATSHRKVIEWFLNLNISWRKTHGQTNFSVKRRFFHSKCEMFKWLCSPHWTKFRIWLLQLMNKSFWATTSAHQHSDR